MGKVGVLTAAGKFEEDKDAVPSFVNVIKYKSLIQY